MKKNLLFSCLLLLGGCASLPTAPSSADTTQAAAVPASPPDAPFTSESLYQLLVAELAGQRNQPRLALDHYSQQARQTGSARVSERAWRIADYLNIRANALANAKLWARNAPDNAEAHRALALELARNQQAEASMLHLEQAIRLDPDSDEHFDFLVFAASHASPATRSTLLKQFEQLQQRYPQQDALNLARALLLQEEQPAAALALLENRKASNRSLPALLLQARLQQHLEQPERALNTLQHLVRRYPGHNPARLALARQLISLERLPEARTAFLQLLQDEPDNDEFRMALAYLNMDLDAWQEAAGYLEELIQRDRFTNTAYFNLGRCQEALEQPEQARQSYSQVQPGQFYLPARQRLGELLLDAGLQQSFIRSFAQARNEAPDQADTLWQIEAEVLARRQQTSVAEQRIEQALQEFPDSHNLLYARAMLAEKRNDLKQLESDLRRILADDPEHAIALNALGYTLADRNLRLPEALELIQKAHELQPEDAATLDSLGWVHFKLGQPEQALPLLQQAHDQYPDPEVAAHLGEVLWALGQTRQARKVWKSAARETPDHPVLRDTLQRLTGRPEIR